MRRKAICITLDPNDLDRIRKMADREERSISYMINLFIKEALTQPQRVKRIIERAPVGRYARQ